MWHAIVTAMALLAPAQAPAPAETKAEKAAAAAGWPAPTRLSLDFRDRTLAEIVDGINARGPTMLAVGRTPGARLPRDGAQPTPRYTVVEPEPVTFWEAVDRVARATQSWPASGNTPAGKLGILLVPDSPDRGFAANDGAFRVVVTGTHYSSRFQFSPYFYNQRGLEQPRADGSSRRPALVVGLLIMAEPRLKIVRPVELTVREAVDDRGRSLIPVAPWREPLSKPAAQGFSNQEHVAVPLAFPDDPGERIKRLAGSVTLEVSTDRPGSRSPVATVEVGFQFADVPLP
jgi:hypothetical protein